MKKLQAATLLAALCLQCAGSWAHATTISYFATDLMDVKQGEDLWQYSYEVSDNIFAADTGFTIYFDPGNYGFLEPVSSPRDTDWDIVALQSDPALPDDGMYDAYALVDNPFLSGIFTVRFVWLGAQDGPGSQPFEVYDGISWDVIESGVTSAGTAPVPEPATLFLFTAGLAGLVGNGIRRRGKW